jgi:radical SAM superfamily enzyme YgiQ (UPF0313 family)
VKIALVYPPPWKIATPGSARDFGHDGAPDDYCDGDLDADFFQTPYGLFSLGAQAIRAGHRVKVMNLAGYAWARVEEIIRELDADVFGMSCWTANRRGVALTASLIKRLHPQAKVIVGGPHATPLAPEIIEHHADIDVVTLGESEETFLELLGRIQNGEPLSGVAGTVQRDATGKAQSAAERPAIKQLDALASPHDWFDTHIVMTSRGCPWQCTFCGAETTWGRGFRGQSIPYVVDSLESALSRLPVKMIQIKDDTFTANRKRALDICRGIRQRGLNFLWSCDTRVDVLSEELLREMRLAGCQRLSLGVESGSQRILTAINKKITVDEIVEATQMAKKFGIRLRYYMMLGNRGETAESFRETLAFLERAQPHEYLFSCLSIYPGTLDFHDAEKAGWLKREVYFSGTFQELKTPYDASPEDEKLMGDWFAQNKGLREVYRETADDFRKILDELGDHHAAHLDLGGAYYHEGELDLARHHVQRALELGHPCPGLGYNYLACIALRQGDVQGMMDELMRAAKTDPQHGVLIRNVESARAWFKAEGPERGIPLTLLAQHDFRLLERTLQPTLPGPLPDDFAVWHEHDPPRPVPRPDLVAAGLGEANKRLRVLPVD